MRTLPKTLKLDAAVPLSASRRTVLAAMFVIGLLLTGCGKQWSWHEKIVVEVERPDGVVSGSSVIRRSLTHQNSSLAPPEARGASLGLSGEAVVLELTPGRYLFALLTDLPSSFEVFFPGEAPVEVADRFETFREARDLSPDQYPLLVTFADIHDPTTVRRVDPGNLAATFGPGVSLKGITLEVTDEKAVGGRVDAILPWLGSYYEKKLDGQRYETIKAENRFANSLGAGDFDTRP
jgi:hypothetical protein